MRFIAEENLVFINDKLASLEVMREVALTSAGEEKIRNSVLAKIQQREDEIRASFFEKVEADGTTRVRHPSIGVVEVSHELLPEPRRLFGNNINSLVAYVIEVYQADALVAVNGVVRYEPYKKVGRFVVSENTFNRMLADNGCRSLPVNIEMLEGHDIEESIPDAFAMTAKHLGSKILQTIERPLTQLATVTETLEERAQKGGKLPASVIDELAKIRGSAEFMNNSAYTYIEILGEFSEQVNTAQRLELEALIALKTAGEQE